MRIRVVRRRWGRAASAPGGTWMSKVPTCMSKISVKGDKRLDKHGRLFVYIPVLIEIMSQ